MSMWTKIKALCRLSLHQYLYYNYICRKIHRENGAKIFPKKGTHIQLADSAVIDLKANLILNNNKIKGSKAECLVLMRENAHLTVNGITELYYGTTLQVHQNAVLSLGEAHFNTGTTIICAYKMTLGNLVTSARDVFLFDSDHHPIYNAEGKRINEAREVVIGDHVWLGLKSTVMKGAHIGSGTVVSAHSLVSGNIPEHALVATAPARPVMKDITWER